MSCAICGDVALESLDPRLPMLRLPACGDCRDRIAYSVGWTRAWRSISNAHGVRLRVWNRRGAMVEVPV